MSNFFEKSDTLLASSLILPISSQVRSIPIAIASFSLNGSYPRFAGSYRLKALLDKTFQHPIKYAHESKALKPLCGSDFSRSQSGNLFSQIFWRSKMLLCHINQGFKPMQDPQMGVTLVKKRTVFIIFSG